MEEQRAKFNEERSASMRVDQSQHALMDSEGGSERQLERLDSFFLLAKGF